MSSSNGLCAPIPRISEPCRAELDSRSRCWVPTLDTASERHRSSHQLTVTVTLIALERFWIAGCGEDYGAGDAVLHPRRGRRTGTEEEDVKDRCAVGAGVDGGDGGLVRKRWKLFWDFDGRVASPACYHRLQTRNIFKIILNELTKQF